MAPNTIHSFLGSLQARLRRKGALETLGLFAPWAILGTLALIVFAALVPWALWRPLALVIIVAVPLGLVMFSLWQRGRWNSHELGALFLRASAPGVGGDLLSSLELDQAIEGAKADPALSTELVAVLRTRVSSGVLSLQPQQLVPFDRAVKRVCARTATTALLFLAVTIAWPNGIKRGFAALRLSTRWQDRLRVSSEPLVGDLRLTLTYPPYTRLPPRLFPDSSGHVVALPGTKVRFEGRALVSGPAKLIFEEESATGFDTQLLDVGEETTSAGRMLHVEFTAKKRGRYRVVLDELEEPEPHAIDIEPDRAPRIDLFAPAEMLAVNGGRPVELAFSADDDYGLSDIELVTRSGEGPETRKIIQRRAENDSSARNASGKFEWDTSELLGRSLEPNARIAYHLEVKDNDVVSGPNVGVSRTFYLVLDSLHKRQEEAIGAHQMLIEQALKILADRLETARSTDDKGERIFMDYSQIHDQEEGFLAAVAQAQTNHAGGKILQTTLGEIHGRLSKLIREEQTAIAALTAERHKGPLRASAVRGVEGMNPKHVAEMERDVLALDDLIGREQLEEMLQVGDEMARARDRLKHLVEQYKRTHDPAIKQQIARELREMAQKLAELKSKASRTIGEIPDQFLNRDAMGKNNLDSSLKSIEDLLEKGDVDKAMAELDRMSSQLDKMLASMENDLRGYRQERFSSEEKALADAESKLRDLTHDEEQLRGETESVRQTSREATQKQLRDQIAPAIKKARTEVAKMKKDIEELQPQGLLSPFSQEEAAQTKRKLEDLDRMLGESDLEESAALASEAADGMKSLGADLKRDSRAPSRRAHDKMESDENTARKLQREMAEMVPKGGGLGEAGAQKLSELEKRQQATRKRAQDLSKPEGMPPGFGDGIKEAGRHMERAEEHLRGHSARDASGEESQALDKLSQLKDQLQHERRPREQQGSAGLDKEPVKIPGADAFRAPKEFRQDLLEAMKRQAPREYKEQVKRYYEELVK